MRVACFHSRPANIAKLQEVSGKLDIGFHFFVGLQRLEFTFGRESFDLVVFQNPCIDDATIKAIERIRSVKGSHFPQIVCLFSIENYLGSLSAFQAGADLCLHDAISALELAARMSALLRRNRRGSDSDRSFRVDQYEFRLDRGEVVINDAASPALTLKEFLIAVELFRNIGRTLSRNHLIESVWKHGWHAGPSSRTLDTHISRVRQKLSLSGGRFALSSIYNFGYRLDRLIDPTSASPGTSMP